MAYRAEKMKGDGSLGIHCQDCVHTGKSELILRFYLQSLARDLLPAERVKDCMRTIAPFQSNVEIVMSDGSARARYRNLIVCSRIWQCAVCASTITEGRRRELTVAIAKSDLYPVLLTYTLRHNISDRLSDLLPALLKAFRAYKSGRLWQEFSSDYFWAGSIRALEVTHTDNGWHPHLHELALISVPVNAAIEHGITEFAKRRWREVIQRQGFDASWEHGADVRTEDHEIREYVAKFGKLPNGTRWSVEHELTKAPSKRGRMNGRTPMQILMDYGDGDARSAFLFIEYAKAFKGRNQLVWSRGLRELLGLGDELSDEDLANDQADSGRVLATLTRADWKIILSLKHRGELLEFASHATEEQLADYINDLLQGEKVNTPA